MVYIGSDNELPLIGRDAGGIAILVEDLDLRNRDDKFACDNLTKQYKYFIGSYQGCGCGFMYDFARAEPSNIKDEYKGFLEEIIEKQQKGKQSFETLFEYIRTNVKGDNCELLSFWTGEGIEHDNSVIDLKTFSLGHEFKFLNGQYLTVYK